MLPSLYSQAALERLRTGRAQLPPLVERLLATGEHFAVPVKGDTDRVHQEMDPRTARTQLGSQPTPAAPLALWPRLGYPGETASGSER